MPRSDHGAATRFRKAADQEDSEAHFNLATQYRQGLGVPKNTAKDFSWLRKAATQGHQGAMNCVAEFEAAQPPAQMEPEVCANGGALEDTDGAALKPCARLKTAAQSGKEFQKGHWKAPDEHKGYYYNQVRGTCLHGRGKWGAGRSRRSKSEVPVFAGNIYTTRKPGISPHCSPGLLSAEQEGLIRWSLPCWSWSRWSVTTFSHNPGSTKRHNPFSKPKMHFPRQKAPKHTNPYPCVYFNFRICCFRGRIGLFCS